jgi:hypothetical protein
MQMARPVDVFITLIDPRESRSAWGRVGTYTPIHEPFTVGGMDSTASQPPKTEYRKAVKIELCHTNTGAKRKDKQLSGADMSVEIGKGKSSRINPAKKWACRPLTTEYRQLYKSCDYRE